MADADCCVAVYLLINKNKQGKSFALSVSLLFDVGALGRPRSAKVRCATGGQLFRPRLLPKTSLAISIEVDFSREKSIKAINTSGANKSELKLSRMPIALFVDGGAQHCCELKVVSVSSSSSKPEATITNLCFASVSFPGKKNHQWMELFDDRIQSVEGRRTKREIRSDGDASCCCCDFLRKKRKAREQKAIKNWSSGIRLSCLFIAVISFYCFPPEMKKETRNESSSVRAGFLLGLYDSPGNLFCLRLKTSHKLEEKKTKEEN